MELKVESVLKGVDPTKFGFAHMFSQEVFGYLDTEDIRIKRFIYSVFSRYLESRSGDSSITFETTVRYLADYIEDESHVHPNFQKIGLVKSSLPIRVGATFENDKLRSAYIKVQKYYNINEPKDPEFMKKFISELLDKFVSTAQSHLSRFLNTTFSAFEDIMTGNSNLYLGISGVQHVISDDYIMIDKHSIGSCVYKTGSGLIYDLNSRCLFKSGFIDSPDKSEEDLKVYYACVDALVNTANNFGTTELKIVDNNWEIV